MDLTHLLINSPKQGARGEPKKTVEDFRQGLYKRTGVKTSSEGRNLRSIQVREKDVSLSSARYIPEEI